MQTTIIRTADGDRLDLICYKAGVLIYLPEMPTATNNDKNKVVKLWS